MLACAQIVVFAISLKNVWIFSPFPTKNRLSRSASPFMAISCFIVAILLKLAWRFEPIRNGEICWMNNNFLYYFAKNKWRRLQDSLTSKYVGFKARALCLLPSSSKYAAKLSASSNADTAFSTAFMTRFACPYRAFVFSSSDGGTSLNSGNRRWYSGFFSKNLRTKKCQMSLSNRGIVFLVFSDVICQAWDAVFHQQMEHREERWEEIWGVQPVKPKYPHINSPHWSS